MVRHEIIAPSKVIISDSLSKNPEVISLQIRANMLYKFLGCDSM